MTNQNDSLKTAIENLDETVLRVITELEERNRKIEEYLREYGTGERGL